MSEPRYKQMPKVPQEADTRRLRQLVDTIRQNLQQIILHGGMTDAQFVERYNRLIKGQGSG